MNETRLANNGVRVTPLTGSIGAEVNGVSLPQLSDEEFESIHEAFLTHCMLVFPGQGLSIDEHVEFASRWGEPGTSPFVKYLDGYPCVLPLTNRGKAGTVTENWHHDSTFLPEPPAATILVARNVPTGGDTMWSNQYLAYETLSDGMKTWLEGIRAEFTGSRLSKLAGSDRPIPRSFHPVVRTHPETESQPVLKFLYEHSTRPDRIYRHRWSNGDVVMWDNRCTMHYAVHDFGDDAVRDLHRISIKGTVPV